METKQCVKCDNWFDITSFKMTKRWRGNVCQSCRNAQRKNHYHNVEKVSDDYMETNRNKAKEWRKDNSERHSETCRTWRNSTDKGYWNNKITSIKANCRGRGLDCSIKRQDLEDLYESQNGKCVLSGRELLKTRTKSKLDTCSVDRIDNSKGYELGNIRLITLQANLCKSTGTDEELLIFCKDVIKTLESQNSSLLERL